MSTVHDTLSRSKGQGHKVMRRSSTKTSNISSKRHSVVEMPFLLEIEVAGATGGVRFLTGSSLIAVSAHAR